MTPTSRSRIRAARALSLLLLAAVPVASLIPASAPARATNLFDSTSDEVTSLVEKAKPAVVKVRSGTNSVLAGTGFFIDDRGTLLTSSSILGDNTTARVVLNGVEMDAKILGNDPRSGLAMLRVSYDESPALPLGHSDDLKSGNGVITIGYPLNLPVTFSQGPVSGFDISFLTRVEDPAAPKDAVSAVERFATTHIHANVSISPGQVGSPLLNARGEVVGIVATSPDEGRTIYALPVEAMDKIIADFNQYGRARHGWVGVNVVEAADTSHDGRTVRVVQAVPGTPASESGIERGDTVMRIDAREIYRPGDVLDASFFSHVGGNMTVVVRRDDKLYNYTFAVIERPQNPAAPTASTGTALPLTSAPVPPAEAMMVKHVAADAK